MLPAESTQFMFDGPEWYDRSVNWAARFERELPVLGNVFGPPVDNRVLDAGCGTGRHAVALAERGYQVTGIDLSEPMLELARQHVQKSDADVSLICCGYADAAKRLGGGFGGVLCIGNSLAAAGTEAAARGAIDSFGAVLRPGGHLFVQTLNFPHMRNEMPCVRGPRVARHEGVEYVSFRLFHFATAADAGPSGRADVTNVTLWNDGAWKYVSRGGSLYPMTRDELCCWCDGAGLEVIDTFGAYDRSPFDAAQSQDLILVARKRA